MSSNPSSANRGFVDEGELKKALLLIRDLRLAIFRQRIDPWAARQALLIAVEIDRHAAISRGVPEKQLDVFDGLAIGSAKQLAVQLNSGVEERS